MCLDDQLAWWLVLVWRWPGRRIGGREGAWGAARKKKTGGIFVGNPDGGGLLVGLPVGCGGVDGQAVWLAWEG